MKKRTTLLMCLVLAAALLLSGCSVLTDYLQRLDAAVNSGSYISYRDMDYVRPDMDALERTLEESCRIGRESDDLDAVLDAIYAYYDVYDSFYTNLSLSYIRYCGDLTDTYWSAEYDFCSANYPTADAGLEELYCALAESPIRETLEGDSYFGADYFDAYEDGGVWDEAFLSLLEREAALQNRYYEITSLGDISQTAFLDTHYETLAQVLVELVALRQQIAAHMGYGDYTEFAYDFYHSRDYTPEQALAYTDAIRDGLVTLYYDLDSDAWDTVAPSTRKETFDFVRGTAENMGGYVQEAFSVLEAGGLYDIDPGENKANLSFEVYLDSYHCPFVFVNPVGTAYDKLTFAHEFGHFAHDYVCYGSYAGTDIAEVLSQGMEYLSLIYGPQAQDLEKLKLADSLCVYVEQAAYAAFEHRLYSLAGEDLTAENIRQLYAQTAQDFGFDSWDWDSRDFVRMTHYYTEPMYIISYVVSNDAAFQLYQLEKEQAGAGLALYEKMLFSEESRMLTFAQEMGLQSPLDPQRVETVRRSMEQILG